MLTFSRTDTTPTALTLDKPVLRAGSYTHPLKGWELDLDELRLERMADTVRQMIADGVTVDITVDHSQSARDKLGVITWAWRDQDWLWLRHQFADPEGVAIANRNGEVSVEIEPQLIDGMGRRYIDAIVASSIVRNPVVAGQGGFERMAASRLVFNRA